jgi:hypothetical protein
LEYKDADLRRYTRFANDDGHAKKACLAAAGSATSAPVSMIALANRKGIGPYRMSTRLDTGKFILEDENGIFKGSYDARTDDTYDVTGNLVGGGDWLSALAAGMRRRFDGNL